MIKYFLIILLFITQFSFAQTQPSGFPTQFNTGWQQWGYQQSTLGTIVAKRDTNWLPRFNGTIVFRPQNIRPYFYDSTALRWYKLFSEPDTLTTLATRYDLTQISFTNSNIGSGYRWAVPNTNNIKTVFASNTILWDSTSNANGLTPKADTSVLATQYDLTLIGLPSSPINSIQFNNSNTFGGDSLQYYPAQNKLLTSQDQIQYGRPITGFFQDSGSTYAAGRLWTVYPRHSSGSGADTLQHFFSSIDNTLYDITKPENSVFTLLQFGSLGNNKPYASIRLEQMFYDQTEYHALVTKSRNMPNPNNETRNWSWTISQNNGTANLTTRSSDNVWKLSVENSPYYDREYATLNSSLFNLKGIENPVSIGANAGASQQWGIGMLTDTSSGGGYASLYVTNAVQSLYMGSQGGGTGIDITNPAVSGGSISFNKFTQTIGKEFRATNIPNGTIGVSVTTNAVGFIYSVSADANGFADTRNTGTFLINRDALQSSTTRMLGIYNNYNADDSLFHVRGNGNLWTKGLVNIQTLKTTATAPTTQGTTKMVICDTNGLLSNADLPTSYTFNNGLTNTSGTVQLGGSLIQNTTITSAVAANRLTYSGISTFAEGAQLDVSTTGSVGIAIRGQSTDGRGVFGLATTGVGVYGSATGAAGYGLFGISSGTGGNAIYGSSTSGLVLQGVMNPTSTNTVIPSVSLTRASQSAGANGIGQSVDFYNHTSTTDELANQIISKWTDATNATRTSQFSIVGVNSASTQTIATFAGDGTYTTIGRRIIAVTVSSAGTLTLGNSHSYVFSGTTTTWTLPAVSGTTGVIYYIKNRGSGSITLNANAAANEIYSTSAVSTYEITAGSAIILISDGTYWTIN